MEQETRKHEVYAGGHEVPFDDNYEPTLVLNPQDVARVRVHDENVPETAADEETNRPSRRPARKLKKMKRMMDELTLGRNLGGSEASELVKIELAQRKTETVAK